MKLNIFITITMVLFIASFSAEASTKEKLTTYRNNDYKFVFQYPNGWTQSPSTHAGTKIKIVHNNGQDGEDCMVNVQTAKTAQDRLPSKLFVGSISPTSYEQAIKKSLPDAKIIASGKSSISNQDAFYTTIKYTYRSMGLEIPMKMMQVITTKNNNVYVIGCRAPNDIFDKNIDTYKLVLLGFTFMP